MYAENRPAAEADGYEGGAAFDETSGSEYCGTAPAGGLMVHLKGDPMEKSVPRKAQSQVAPVSESHRNAPKASPHHPDAQGTFRSGTLKPPPGTGGWKDMLSCEPPDPSSVGTFLRSLAVVSPEKPIKDHLVRSNFS